MVNLIMPKVSERMPQIILSIFSCCGERDFQRRKGWKGIETKIVCGTSGQSNNNDRIKELHNAVLWTGIHVQCLLATHHRN